MKNLREKEKGISVGSAVAGIAVATNIITLYCAARKKVPASRKDFRTLTENCGRRKLFVRRGPSEGHRRKRARRRAR